MTDKRPEALEALEYLSGRGHPRAGDVVREYVTALESRIEREEADCIEVMKERDWAQDCLQRTHIALGGDGEWTGKMPAEMPPDSGDLHYDVPALAAEVLARAEAAESQLAARQGEAVVTHGMLRAMKRYLPFGCATDEQIQSGLIAALTKQGDTKPEVGNERQ